MATEPTNQQKSGGTNIWPWTLAVGLLAGFLIGREIGPRGGGGGSEQAEKGRGSGSEPAKAGGSGAGAPAKIYKSENEFPSGWMKSAELVGVPGVSWDGIKENFKVAAMQAMNERDCECGCGMGHVAG